MGCCDPKDSDEVKERQQEELKGSLVANRSCRDIIWLIVFVCFWIGMIIIASFAWHNGEPKRLLYGADSYGNICGQTNHQRIDSVNSGLDMTDYDVLYYRDPTNSDGLKLCLAACPSVSGSVYTCASGTDCQNVHHVCLTSSNPYSDIASDDDCPTEAYNSHELLGLHRCVPSSGVTSSIVSGFYDRLNDVEALQQAIQDYGNAWERMLYCSLIAFGVSILIILLLRILAAPIIYGTVFLGVVACICLTVFLWVQWKRIKDDLDDTPDDQQLDDDVRNEKFFKALMIIALVFTLIILIITIAMRNRIRLTVAVFEEASRAFSHIPQVIFIPFATYLFLLCFFAYWIVVYMFLSTSGTHTKNASGHVEYAVDASYTRMWWYHLFGFFWMSQFIIACGQFILAGAFATWYFTRNKNRVSSPISSSIFNLFRFHLGSIAFGAFIIALVQFARAVLAYLQKKLKGESKIVTFALKCLQCCLWCFEKCLKFLNKNAYIEIAIYGFSFCTAARQAFFTLLRNILRVATLNSIGKLVLLLAKLLVAAGTALAALLWTRNDDDLHFYSLIVFTVFIMAFFIADVFINVYKMAIDTIFLCFCEDQRKNNGKDKPFFATDRMMKFLSGTNVLDTKGKGGKEGEAEAGEGEGEGGEEQNEDEEKGKKGKKGKK